jgi:hypothetical protein
MDDARSGGNPIVMEPGLRNEAHKNEVFINFICLPGDGQASHSNPISQAPSFGPVR